MERNIIHFDMDAFFASVEQMDNPGLKGKPVIVGGTGGRGVVSTCSYQARRFGVHSAMPVFMARRLCPEGVFLPPRHSRYQEVSNRIFKIFERYTPSIERLSIDEAFMDVTGCPSSPLQIVRGIKGAIFQETGLTASAGISYNKFLAKLASDWKKPDGLFIITPDMVPRILLPLKVNKVYGIGDKAAEKLNSLGICTVKDLLALDQNMLEHLLGKLGKEVYDRIRGIDNRPVVSDREVKSIGRETTMRKDTVDRNYLKKLVFEFCKEVSAALYEKNLYGRTVTVKIKTSSFKIITRSRSVDQYISRTHEIYRIASDIMDEIPLDEPIRLVGVSISNLTGRPVEQLSIFHTEREKGKEVDRLVHDINNRMGKDVLKFGIQLKKE